MAEMQELDLMNPGKLWATAEHQKDTTFHIVMPDEQTEKDNIKEGVVDPGFDLVPPLTVPFGNCDANGVASFDLDSTGRAMDMLHKLTEHYSKGGETIEKVRAVVVATARDGNKIPEKAVAEVMDMKLLACPIIMLKGIETYVTVQNFKGGKTQFTAEFKIKGPCPEVEISVAAEQDLTVNGQKGHGKLVIPTKEGETYKVTVAVPLVKSGETQQRAVPRRYIHFYPWGWRTAGGRMEYDTQTFTREKWTGATLTLKVAGTKENAKVFQSVQLKAEDWASDWLAGPPPAPFYHNNC